jgi:hypothetical protein
LVGTLLGSRVTGAFVGKRVGSGALVGSGTGPVDSGENKDGIHELGDKIDGFAVGIGVSGEETGG